MKPEEPKNLRDISFFMKSIYLGIDLIDKPITWLREKIVNNREPSHVWYHEKVRRVPTIDECFSDDVMCQYEAEIQYRLDKKVDDNIIKILKRKARQCRIEFGVDASECESMNNDYDNALQNYFIKYGDLGRKGNSALYCYMKQKHRMAWERRHGPVGSGRKVEELYPEKETC